MKITTYKLLISAKALIGAAVFITFLMGQPPVLAAATNAPVITSFSPSHGTVGTNVLITGSNFIPPLSIVFGGNTAASGSFTSTEITVTVPSGAVTGPITVTTSNGSAATATDFVVGGATTNFFTGAIALANGVYYLTFTDSNLFGYYSFVSSQTLYHFDIGYLYFFDANDGKGAYFYDYTSDHFWYTSTALFPYVYDFSLNAWLYYYPNTQSAGHYTSNPRYFYNFGTSQIITE